MRNKRLVSVYRMEETYKTEKNGLFGNERKVFLEMFEKDGKTPIRFKKLNPLQKKVLEKIKLNKFHFLDSIKD